MEYSLYVLILLIEWILLVTIGAPLFFAGRFRKAPTVGIFVWLAAISSTIIATIWAGVVAVGFVFESYFRLREGDDVASVLLLSFAPWLLMGFAGILLALANQRLANLFTVDSDPAASLLGAKYKMQFQSAKVFELALPGYLALTRKKEIYLSKPVFDLPSEQLQAILHHEQGHIFLRHGMIKRFAFMIFQLLPWVVASRAMKSEIDVLAELAADNYALKRVTRKDLNAARRLFI